MFKGFSKETEAFLWDLKFNNERSWFNENKERFEEYLNTPFRDLGNETFERFNSLVPGSGLDLHISRIYRDARRLYGRGPYKENLWFSIEDRSKKYNGASFYFEVEPSGYSYGMGFWAPQSSMMESFRKSIDANPAAFERLAKPIFDSGKYAITGELYKKPKGFYNKYIDPWYNRKWVSVSHGGDFGGELYDGRLPEILAGSFADLMPMFEYLSAVADSVYK